MKTLSDEAEFSVSVAGVRHLKLEVAVTGSSKYTNAVWIAPRLTPVENSPPSPAKQEGAKAKLAYLEPAFEQWVNATQALPAEKQIDAVSKKLVELNPGFDGKLMGYHSAPTPVIRNGVITEIGFETDAIVDVSPLRALAGATWLTCQSRNLADLRPIKGMAIRRLSVSFSLVTDLSPLTGMPLDELFLYRAPVTDLTPLGGMPLKKLDLRRPK